MEEVKYCVCDAPIIRTGEYCAICGKDIKPIEMEDKLEILIKWIEANAGTIDLADAYDKAKELNQLEQ